MRAFFCSLLAMTGSSSCLRWLFPHLFSYNSFAGNSINSVFYSVTISYGLTRSFFPFFLLMTLEQRLCGIWIGFECGHPSRSVTHADVSLFPLPTVTVQMFRIVIVIVCTVECRNSYCNVRSSCRRSLAQQLRLQPKNNELSEPLQKSTSTVLVIAVFYIIILTPANTVT
jgi:hypothetical protein